ncbi:MAG: glycosyltransferase family 2 protein [Elusimicrobia bacterium]|nr:glycosyltransferase family 2 protein [Elusimicrobiota bacterium]
MPFFSIILPTYNRARMLPSALSTVKRQSFQDFEVLIVDDGSTDDTPRMIEEWTRDSRFKYHRLEKNIGNMHCRNLALGMASGAWITNIDSDDFWTLDRLEVFARHIQARPQAGFVFSNGYLYRYGRIIGMAFDPSHSIKEGKVPGYYAVGEEFLPYLTTNLAIPRELYLKYGNYRKDMIILDNELYARMLEDGVEIAVIREPLAVRRIHEGQVTHKWIEEYPEAVEALKACGTPAEILRQEKEKLVYEVADYLWRALKPKEARDFMLRELGNQAKDSPLYFKTFVPPGALAWAKSARRFYLMLRHHPVWASPEVREVYALINPLLAKEARDPKNA